MSDEDAVEVEQPEETVPYEADGATTVDDSDPETTDADDASGDADDVDADADDADAAAGADAEDAEGDANDAGADTDDVDTGDAGVNVDDADAKDEREEDDPLVDRVADHDEGLAREVAALEAELEEAREDAEDARAEVEELTSKLARVRADFSNYKQRAKRKREEIRERASEALVERIAPVRNDLLRALDQEEGSDIRPGVESTVEKFDEVLAEEGVDPIEPEPGTEVDPARHQVMLRVESDQPEGTVHDVYEPGYEMGDRVIAEAQVTVSQGEE